MTVRGQMNEIADFLPLTAPVFHILLALADGERHGYAILQEIDARSDSSVKLGTGTLYTAIKRMLATGLIERAESHVDPEHGDERRGRADQGAAVRRISGTPAWTDRP